MTATTLYSGRSEEDCWRGERENDFSIQRFVSILRDKERWRMLRLVFSIRCDGCFGMNVHKRRSIVEETSLTSLTSLTISEKYYYFLAPSSPHCSVSFFSLRDLLHSIDNCIIRVNIFTLRGKEREKKLADCKIDKWSTHTSWVRWTHPLNTIYLSSLFTALAYIIYQESPLHVIFPLPLSLSSALDLSNFTWGTGERRHSLTHCNRWTFVHANSPSMLLSRLSSLVSQCTFISLSTQNWSSYFILSFTLFYVISQAISLSETHCNVISDCKCDCTMLHPSTCPLIHFSSLSLSHSLPLCPCAAASLLIHVSCDASIW